MKENYFEEAMQRTIIYTPRAYRTLQFDNYDEMYNKVKVGDTVLVFKNLGRNAMTVKNKEGDKIWLSDDVDGFYYYKSERWTSNGIELVIREINMYEMED